LLAHGDEIAIRASLDVAEEKVENPEEFNLNLPEEDDENQANPEEIEFAEKEVVIEDNADFENKNDMREPLRL